MNNLEGIKKIKKIDFTKDDLIEKLKQIEKEPIANDEILSKIVEKNYFVLKYYNKPLCLTKKYMIVHLKDGLCFIEYYAYGEEKWFVPEDIKTATKEQIKDIEKYAEEGDIKKFILDKWKLKLLFERKGG